MAPDTQAMFGAICADLCEVRWASHRNALLPHTARCSCRGLPSHGFCCAVAAVPLVCWRLWGLTRRVCVQPDEPRKKKKKNKKKSKKAKGSKKADL